MARIVPLPGGGHQVRWYDGRRNDAGKLIETGGQRFDTLGEARAEKRRIEAMVRARKEAARANGMRVLSLPALLILWREWSATRKATRAGYRAEKERKLLELFTARGWKTVRDITQPAIEAWRASVQGVGTDKPLQWLKTLLRFAEAVHRQPIDRGSLLTLPRKRVPKPAPPLLTPTEVDWILALAQVRDENAYAILDHLTTYPCRPIDACRFRCRDFNPATGEITMRDPKNHTSVTHPLLPRHVERYARWHAERKPSDPLFLNPYGEGWRITPARATAKAQEERAEQLTSWYWNRVSRHLHEGGQRGIYCLKDYAMTRMEAVGIDDRTKALFSGHKTLAVMERYKTTNAQRAREALGKLE